LNHNSRSQQLASSAAGWWCIIMYVAWKIIEELISGENSEHVQSVCTRFSFYFSRKSPGTRLLHNH